MDVIKMRQENRERIIRRLVDSMKASMERSGNSELTFDFESIVIAGQGGAYCSRRTAMEYANIALYKMGLDRKDLADAPKDDKTQKTLELLNGK